MTNGWTYWIPTDCCCQNPSKYPSSNTVSSKAAPGADDPYESDYTRVGKTKRMKQDPVAYGPNDGILTNDPRGRWIHGGGTRLGHQGSQAAYQPLVPTMGCTRMHNEDLKTLSHYWKEHKKRQPEDPVPYSRRRLTEGTNPVDCDDCMNIFKSAECERKRKKGCCE